MAFIGAVGGGRACIWHRLAFGTEPPDLVFRYVCAWWKTGIAG